MSALTFNEAVEQFAKTKAAFNENDMRSIVNHNMSMLKKSEAQIIEDGGEVNYHIDAYRWNLEQEITNRDSGQTMTDAAYSFTENLQNRMFSESGLGYE